MEACIGCSVDRYCGCNGANRLFDVEKVMKKRLVNIGDNVKMSEPLKVERKLLTGYDIFASLSHKGVLAVYAATKSLQFTDLNRNRQVEINVENYSQAGFYDNKVVLLTNYKPLREADVESVFENITVEMFEEIEGTINVLTCTDVSLLHKRRVLYYRMDRYGFFAFNVDTRENTEIDIEEPILIIPSLGGIDCGIEAVFQNEYDNCPYVLNADGTVTRVGKRQANLLTTVFASGSNPKNIENAVFRHDCDLVKCKDKMDISHLIKPDWYSVVRVFKNVFLAYDTKTKSWILFRLVVS